jgi:ribosome assembly protein YihI (activator of Der GTPase)
VTEAEFKKLDRLLARLDDCDLSKWDRDFVDDMIKRIGKYEDRTIVSGRQQAQINRMEDQYL